MADVQLSGGLPASSPVDRFLSPEAMLTPGAAGGVIVLISNALASNFDLPKAQIGLVLSFVFGLLALARPAQWWLRATYYLLNSLIIFCVAFGAGSLTYSPGGPTPTHVASSLSSVYAEENPRPPPGASTPPATQPSPPAKTTAEPKGWNNPFQGPCSIIKNPLGKNC